MPTIRLTPTVPVDGIHRKRRTTAGLRLRGLLGAVLLGATGGAWAGELTVTTVGAGTWTVPAGVTHVQVVAVGGGGGGSGAAGGAGATVTVNAYAVTPGASMAYVVGGGGGSGDGYVGGGGGSSTNLGPNGSAPTLVAGGGGAAGFRTGGGSACAAASGLGGVGGDGYGGSGGGSGGGGGGGGSGGSGSGGSGGSGGGSGSGGNGGSVNSGGGGYGGSGSGSSTGASGSGGSSGSGVGGGGGGGYGGGGGGGGGGGSSVGGGGAGGSLWPGMTGTTPNDTTCMTSGNGGANWTAGTNGSLKITWVPVSTFTGTTVPMAGPGGSAMGSFTTTGNSSPTCAIDTARTGFQAAPAGTNMPQGVLRFALTGCTPGFTAHVTITWPQPVGAQYMKWGKASASATTSTAFAPTNVVVSGNTVSFDVTDGQLGDDDWNATNGEIVDPSGPFLGLVAAPGATTNNTPIPTLGEWALALLGLAAAGLGLRRLRRGRQG